MLFDTRKSNVSLAHEIQHVRLKKLPFALAGLCFTLLLRTFCGPVAITFAIGK
jgi:hypothetical protein